MVAYIDMHLDGGRYTDQTKIRTPAALFKTNALVEVDELTFGDRLLLSQSLLDVIRLTALGLEH